MKDYDQRLEQANAILATYAVPIHGTLGRTVEEEPDASRFPFQRDRGRIIHTPAFRRLKGKTQVFVTGEGDHYRTRLTHSMEVAQISRDIARTLSLNEDLAECIALAHDLGHPPFGHLGEESLNEWMSAFGRSFEHNLQSHRIVTVLEGHSSLFTGLNLNQEALDGLLKHHTPHDDPEPLIDRGPSLEAQVVNLADEIAYTAHDCDDGLKAGVFTFDAIQEIPIVALALERTQPRNTSLRGGLIELMVNDLYQNLVTNDLLQRMNTIQDIYNESADIVLFSSSMRSMLDELRTFLWNNMYLHPDVLGRSTAGKELVINLCTALHANPSSKVLALLPNADGALEVAVKDYVAGMTDWYAEAMYGRMNG
ncbi:MAG: dNTP triphosphohydrolase [bacterium]|nr:dNTP triphosphohydrolase [bacterium]